MDWGFYGRENLHYLSKERKKERKIAAEGGLDGAWSIYIQRARGGWYRTVRSRKSRHTAFTYKGSSALVGILCFHSSYMYFILVLRSARYTVPALIQCFSFSVSMLKSLRLFNECLFS